MRFTEGLVSFAKGWTWNHDTRVRTSSVVCIGLGVVSLWLGDRQFAAEKSQGEELLSETNKMKIVVTEGMEKIIKLQDDKVMILGTMEAKHVLGKKEEGKGK